MPEGQEDDRLDDAELEDRVVWAEQLLGSRVEENESIQGQSDGDVVDYRDVQVASSRSATKNNMLQRTTCYRLNLRSTDVVDYCDIQVL